MRINKPFAQTISTTLDFRHNSFDFLRFFFAVLVVFHHTFPLGGFGEDPINILTNYKESAGTIAVAGFFIISGFLITRSLVYSSSLSSFAIKRFLRITPAFWVCLLVTAFIAAPIVYFIEKNTLSGFLTAANGPIQYIKSNFFILMHQYSIAGLLSSNPHPTTFDGSLWTLFLEVKAYILLGLIGIAGIKKYRNFLIPAIFLVLWSLIIFDVPIKDSPNKFLRLIMDSSFLHFATYFFAGATAFIFADKIHLNTRIFLLFTGIFIASFPLGLIHSLMPFLLPVILIWLAAKLPFQKFGAHGDFSYGIYIYAFPIQQLISFFGLNVEMISYFIMSLAASFILGVLSWNLIEKPALNLKRFLKRNAWYNWRMKINNVGKFKNNFKVYKSDIKTKGVYWSLIHRMYKIPKARNVLAPIVKILKPSYIMLGNDKLYIDKNDEVVSQELIQSGKWEPYETEIFKKSIKKGDTVLDIGAHIGYYTVIAAKIVGPSGKVYAFEPDPKNFSLLTKSIIENNYNNITLINKAVSNKTGKLRLFTNPQNTGDHRVYNSKDNRENISINAIKLDDYFNKNERVDFIKIDIQGAEYDTLNGAKKIISQNKKIKILTEIEPLLLRLSGNSIKKYVNLLVNFDFKLYNINEQNKSIKIINSKDLMLLPEIPFVKANLLCNK